MRRRALEERLNIVEISSRAQQLCVRGEAFVPGGKKSEADVSERCLCAQVLGDRGHALAVSVADDPRR